MRRFLGLAFIIFFIPIILFPKTTILAQNSQISFEEALAKEGITAKEYETIFMYYYMNPQPEKVISMVKAILTQNELLSDYAHFAPFAHYVATLAHNNPTFLNQLRDLEKKDYSSNQRQALQKMITHAENYKSPELLPFRGMETALDLDCLWYEFFVTGKDEPVKKIIDFLEFPTTIEMDLVIAAQSSATWSLTANAKQHKKVYEIIQKESGFATGELKEKLEHILKRASEK